MFQNAGNRRRETKERTDEMEQKKEIRIGGKKLARARSEEKKDVGKEGDDSERMGRDLRKHTATIDRNKEEKEGGEELREDEVDKTEKKTRWKNRVVEESGDKVKKSTGR